MSINSNKFLNYNNLYDILNLTTSNVILIVKKIDGTYDRSALDCFNDIYARLNEMPSQFGGYNKYINKYIKYITKIYDLYKKLHF